jgi:hypothetical protein
MKTEIAGQRYDIHHNDTHHNDTHHNDIHQNYIQHNDTQLNNILPLCWNSNFIFHHTECDCHFAKCRYVKCRYVECCHAECRYTECRGDHWAYLVGAMTLSKKTFDITTLCMLAKWWGRPSSRRTFAY